MVRAYVGLGSNIEPEANIRAAARLLAARERVAAVSTFYRTEAIPPGAPSFINGVLALDTPRPPLALKVDVLRDVEARLGRARTADKNAPRTIDCDLLLYGDRAERDDGLVLPSPDIQKRAFIAIPLHEIAPDLVLPGTGETIADVCASLAANGMSPLAELTDSVRRELKEEDHGSSPHRGAHPTAPR